MSADPQPKIKRAKELLRTVRHAAMATVNEDGSPHNTPYFFATSDSLEYIYWASNPDAQHSQNVARTGQGFLVLYDAFQGGGLYLRLEKAHATEGTELKTAFDVFNKRAKRFDKKLPGLEHYQKDGPERIYSAVVQQFWVNDAERDADGFIIRDRRIEIAREDLQK